MCMLSPASVLSRLCDPWTVTMSSSDHGIFPTEYGHGLISISSSREIFLTQGWNHICTAVPGFFTAEPPRSPVLDICSYICTYFSHRHTSELLFLRGKQKQNKDFGYPVTTLRWPYFWIHVLVMVNI